MPTPHKLDRLAAERGVPLRDLLLARLNATGSMERLAVELGVSYGTLWHACKRVGIVKDTYYRARTDGEYVA